MSTPPRRPPPADTLAAEVKRYRYRILGRKQGERVTLWTRHGTNFTDRLPKVAEAVRCLPAD